MCFTSSTVWKWELDLRQQVAGGFGAVSGPYSWRLTNYHACTTDVALSYWKLTENLTAEHLSTQICTGSPQHHHMAKTMGPSIRSWHKRHSNLADHPESYVMADFWWQLCHTAMNTSQLNSHQTHFISLPSIDSVLVFLCKTWFLPCSISCVTYLHIKKMKF